MDFDLYRRIIDDASKVGVKRIHLYLHGEPMLHSRIVDMVRYAKKKGMSIHLITNGMAFGKTEKEAILASGVTRADHIKFSVLGYSKEVHEEVMKGVAHQTVVDNILEFLEMRKRRKMNAPVIEIVLYEMPQNKHESEKFARYWRGIIDHVHIAGLISESFSQYDKKPDLDIARKRTCTKIWERMTVYWNGEVALCGQDLDGQYILGDLKENFLSEVWNGEPLRFIQSIHQNKEFQKFAMCYKCDA